MIVRFRDLASASIFAAKKSSEGYYAEVLHIHSGHLWGPLATFGFSVIVSDCAAAEGEEVPEADVAPPRLIHWMGAFLLVLSVGMVGLFSLLAVLAVLRSLLNEPEDFMRLVLTLVICAPLFAFYVYFLNRCLSIYRDSRHSLHLLVQCLVIIVSLLAGVISLFCM